MFALHMRGTQHVLRVVVHVIVVMLFEYWFGFLSDKPHWRRLVLINIIIATIIIISATGLWYSISNIRIHDCPHVCVLQPCLHSNHKSPAPSGPPLCQHPVRVACHPPHRHQSRRQRTHVTFHDLATEVISHTKNLHHHSTNTMNLAPFRLRNG